MVNVLYSATPPVGLDLVHDRPTEADLGYWISWIGQLLDRDDEGVLEIVGRTNRLRLDREGADLLRELPAILAALLDPDRDHVRILFPHQGDWVEIHHRRVGPDRFRVTTHDGYAGHGPVVYDRVHTRPEVFQVYGTAFRRVVSWIREVDAAALAEPCVAGWVGEVEALLGRA